MTIYDNLLKRLANQEIVLPMLENAMRAAVRDGADLHGGVWEGRGDGYFHPSTHPLMGERQLYYLFHPDTQKFAVDEPFSLEREMAAGVGTSLHEILQRHLVRTGLVKPENVEKMFTIEEHHVRGRIDAIVDHLTRGPIVVEIKSRTHFKFAKTELLPKWEAQLSIQLDSQGLETGIILMVESGYPFRMREIPVARNDALLSEIYSKFDRVREAIALNRAPIYCCAPNSPTVTTCPVRFACWLHPDGPR